MDDTVGTMSAPPARPGAPGTAGSGSTPSLDAGAATAAVEADPSAPGSVTRKRPRQILIWFALGWLGLVAVAAVTGPWLPLADPENQDLSNRLAGPFTSGHLLGTDDLGRDILARLVAGSRISVVIGLSAVGIGMVVGGTLGLLVGYFRGWVEGLTMATVNTILAFPGLVLLLGLVAFVGRSLTAITLVIGFLSVPTYARVARATTLAVSQREYVLSARALGASNGRILIGEILPNVVLPVMAFGLVALGTLIVLETALAFLGLSVDAPTWGSMIADGRQHLHTTGHLAFIPSVVVFLTVLAVNFVGDVARSRFDLKESRL